jgi:hypothetical protein
LRQEINRAALEKFSRAVGKGRTILLPGLMPDAAAIALITVSQLPDKIDGRIDNRFATRTDGGILWFDAATATISKSKP